MSPMAKIQGVEQPGFKFIQILKVYARNRRNLRILIEPIV